MEDATKEKEETPISTVDLSHLAGACLYLRRAVTALTLSLMKEKLLFHLDRLIEMDIGSDPEGAMGLIEMMEQIVKEGNVTYEIRHSVLYLKESFLKWMAISSIHSHPHG